MYADSLDKIVTAYFAAVADEPFTYKGRRFLPKRLVVSPGIFRHYTCPAHCGGCCPRFSLVYLPADPKPTPGQDRHLRRRVVAFGGRRVLLVVDPQTDHRDHFCRHLDRQTGRCTVHGRQPFSCDFELLRVLHGRDEAVLTQKLFGRGWAMLRVDGARGARCEMIPMEPAHHADLLRRLGRLRDWLVAFGLGTTRIDRVIEWCRTGPHDAPLRLDPVATAAKGAA